MAQLFKNDEIERKFLETFRPLIEGFIAQKELFFDDAYNNYQLGDLLYDTARAPLANAIPRQIFRESFAAVFDAFLVAGTFESYITVFKKIFGDDVVVTFTVPDPGKLTIDVEAAGFELSDFIARYIVSNEYVFDEIIDDENDNIAFQTVKGFETQYELEQMLFEMVPGGIYTEITLTVG